MINVSDLTGYLTCPRLCYFRMRFGTELNEMNAVREIYLSLRKGYDLTWAENRFLELGGDKEVFKRAKVNFEFLNELEILKPVDWEVKLESERYRLRGILDELVEFRSNFHPLILSLKSPQKDVRFKERIKVSAFCMLLKERDVNCDYGFVYYCYDGVLRRVDVGRRERYYVLKLVEKVERIKKGFMPEKGKNAKCEFCEYGEVCQSKPSTFQEKFGKRFML